MTSSDRQAFQRYLARASRVTILSGAGVSAESGIPTFRGAGGLWRTYRATDLASPDAWARDPGLVWEFYNYRRVIMGDKAPNPGHHALATFEQRWRDAGRHMRIITQNIDGLHTHAGSTHVLRLHGSLWQVRDIDTGAVYDNSDVPITPAFEGSGSPDPNAETRTFSEADLPRSPTGGILRPHVVWFGEGLDPEILDAAAKETAQCDVFIVIGTSAVVYPAAGLVPLARQAGAVVAEVNLERTPATDVCDFFFEGKSGEVLPELLDVVPTEA